MLENYKKVGDQTNNLYNIALSFLRPELQVLLVKEKWCQIFNISEIDLVLKSLMSHLQQMTTTFVSLMK